MTIVAWPSVTIKPVRFDWSLVAPTQSAESPLNGSAQTQAVPGAYWTCIVDYSNARGADADLLWAFAATMRGRAGRVRVPTFGKLRPRGTGGGSPLVAGAGQSGTTLAIDGAPVSTTGWLKARDLVQVGDYAHMLTADANTDAGGAVTLQFFPELRTVPADNAAITLANCSTVMGFVGDVQGTSYTAAPMSPFVFTLREYF